METVLYADILFLVNLSMDIVTLYITARLTSSPFSALRACISAAIGALFATAAVALSLGTLVTVAGTGAVSLIMVRIVFDGKGTELICKSAVFWGSGALLGGIMTAVCSLGNTSPSADTDADSASLLFIGSVLCLGAVRLFTHMRRHPQVKLRITLFKRSITLTALSDSGNLLTDPLSGKAVIPVDAAVLSPLIHIPVGEIPVSLYGRVRLIPLKSGGESTVLTGFVPDSVEVLLKNGDRRVDAIIAVTRFGESYFDGHGANFPESLL